MQFSYFSQNPLRVTDIGGVVPSVWTFGPGDGTPFRNDTMRWRRRRGWSFKTPMDTLLQEVDTVVRSGEKPLFTHSQRVLLFRRRGLAGAQTPGDSTPILF